MTEEHKRKIGLANKGKKHTLEQNLAHSKALKGRKASTETKAKMRLARLGVRLSEATRSKISASSMGKPGTNTGKKFSLEHRKKISESQKGKFLTETHKQKITGENSGLWKGDNVGYGGLHIWVRKQLGQPDTCVYCKRSGLSGRRIHWANKSHQYKRDLNDWLRLCAPCHKAYDTNQLIIE